MPEKPLDSGDYLKRRVLKSKAGFGGYCNSFQFFWEMCIPRFVELTICSRTFWGFWQELRVLDWDRSAADAGSSLREKTRPFLVFLLINYYNYYKQNKDGVDHYKLCRCWPFASSFLPTRRWKPPSTRTLVMAGEVMSRICLLFWLWGFLPSVVGNPHCQNSRQIRLVTSPVITRGRVLGGFHRLVGKKEEANGQHLVKIIMIDAIFICL